MQTNSKSFGTFKSVRYGQVSAKTGFTVVALDVLMGIIVDFLERENGV